MSGMIDVSLMPNDEKKVIAARVHCVPRKGELVSLPGKSRQYRVFDVCYMMKDGYFNDVSTKEILVFLQKE